MSTAQLVVQHLPYLRRYARALTRSQMAGDAYVAATLETLVSEPETIGSAGNVKVELFQVFTRIWNSLSVNGRSELPLPRIEMRSCEPERYSNALLPNQRLSLSGSAAATPRRAGSFCSIRGQGTNSRSFSTLAMSGSSP